MQLDAVFLSLISMLLHSQVM